MGRMKDFHHEEINSTTEHGCAFLENDPLPEGYAEYQFMEAFRILCKEEGGAIPGKLVAINLINRVA